MELSLKVMLLDFLIQDLDGISDQKEPRDLPKYQEKTRMSLPLFLFYQKMKVLIIVKQNLSPQGPLNGRKKTRN